MPPSRPTSQDDDYFNNLSHQAPSPERTTQSPQDVDGGGGSSKESGEGGEGYVPRPKRIACILCRKRKLRCDGNKPSCGTCARLGHDCAYDEVRKKSGPKRGYVKLLEARLKQVETMLGSRDGPESTQPASTLPPDMLEQPAYRDPQNIAGDHGTTDQIPQMMPNSGFADPLMNDLGMGMNDDFSWDMIGLGFEEPLPNQDVVDDLTQIYFEKIHPSLPMIHRPRFLAAMNLAPNMRPPICLRYAMWTHVCSITPKYSSFLDHFYARARKYAEQDEMRGHGESMITLAHAQAWTLIASFEFKMMYFPRAWMSCGRATRLSQMMGLHRQDGAGLDVKQCLSPPRDWTEREERRRTFWMVFCQDRYASIGTGWPMTIDEQDILTNLPASEEAFNKSKPERTLPLAEVMTSDGASTLSPFAGVVLMACLFGRNLTHLHRPNEEDKDHDLNGEFWKRHRALDNILLNTSLSLPSQLRLPAGVADSNVVFCNMNIHTSTICLHQAAIFKADKNRMPAQISAESKRRCIIAADQITNIMKMICHVDLSVMNPFIAFCLYVAARVFVQYLKSRRDDATVKSSLHFLLSAMQALKAKNPLTESFLVQLDVDLEGSGLDLPSTASKYQSGPKRPLPEIPVGTDSLKCSPLIDIRSSQVQGQTIEPTLEMGPLPTTDGVPLDYQLFNYGQGSMNQSPLPSRSKVSPRPPMGMKDFSPPMETDMDLSPDATGNQNLSHPSSSHPTPSTSSNKDSSQTSFTPPHFEDTSHPNHTASSNTLSPNNRSASSFFPQHDTYTYQTQYSEANKDGAEGMSNPFAFPAGWDYSADGPNNTATGLKDNNPTGMTPMPIADGIWQGANLLESADWMFSNWNGADVPQR